MKKNLFLILVGFCVISCSYEPPKTSIPYDSKEIRTDRRITIMIFEVEGEQYIVFRDHVHGGIAVAPKIMK